MSDHELTMYAKCLNCRKHHTDTTPYCKSCADSAKHVKCQTCNNEYTFFVNNIRYDAPEMRYCNECLDHSVCCICDEGKDPDVMLFCDGCNDDVSSITCLECAGLESVPEGPWLCDTCRSSQQKCSQERKKRSRVPDETKVGHLYILIRKTELELKELVEKHTKWHRDLDAYSKKTLEHASLVRAAVWHLDNHGNTLEGCKNALKVVQQLVTSQEEIDKCDLTTRGELDALSAIIKQKDFDLEQYKSNLEHYLQEF